MGNFYEKLAAVCGESPVKIDEPMRKHTTFRAGGPAKYLAAPESEDVLGRLIQLCRAEEVPYYILGNGSNLLVSDEGYDGVMVFMGDGFSYVETVNTNEDLMNRIEEQQADVQQADEPEDRDRSVILTAGAGTLLSRIAREALSHSLTGFEFAAGIPGTLGGAVVMNAGAYDGEMKDVLSSIRVLAKDGEILTVPAKDLGLGYRKSRVPSEDWIVLSADIRLHPGDADAVRSRMDELAQRRKEKQPLEFASAGSTFKRPAGYFAGKLIEDAGLRGFRIGDAEVSEKHCGFVINRGTASAAQIRELIREVQRRVKEHSGVDLETEVKFIGWRE